MRSTLWQPLSPVFHQLDRLHGDVNRLFDRWMSDVTHGLAVFPPVNLWEDGEHVYLEAELPGLDPESLDLSVTGGNQFTLKGERKKATPGNGVWHRQERFAGTFSRSLTLPFAVDPDKVEAKLEHGVLRVRLAKHESARPRKITVKAE